MKRIVIDTETSGLRPNQHQVLTVGMLLIDATPHKLDFLNESHLFVKHKEYHLSRSAMRINGIDIKEHDKIGIFPKLVCKKINNFLDEHSLRKTPVVGHNVHFDKNFLKVLFQEEGLDLPFHDEKEDTRYIWARLRKNGLVDQSKNAKLGTIAEHFGVDYTKAHDALADCKITAQVYHKMLPMTKI
ncbi:3'-5' exonuclease [archaeon]|jgi:DNA polymerase III subunit epsilon|nr:3'-5' exonuclease [archaeon]